MLWPALLSRTSVRVGVGVRFGGGLAQEVMFRLGMVPLLCRVARHI